MGGILASHKGPHEGYRLKRTINGVATIPKLCLRNTIVLLWNDVANGNVL